MILLKGAEFNLQKNCIVIHIFIVIWITAHEQFASKSTLHLKTMLHIWAYYFKEKSHYAFWQSRSIYFVIYSNKLEKINCGILRSHLLRRKDASSTSLFNPFCVLRASHRLISSPIFTVVFCPLLLNHTEKKKKKITYKFTDSHLLMSFGQTITKPAAYYYYLLH